MLDRGCLVERRLDSCRPPIAVAPKSAFGVNWVERSVNECYNIVIDAWQAVSGNWHCQLAKVKMEDVSMSAAVLAAKPVEAGDADASAKAVGSEMTYRYEHVSDSDLLANTRRLVGRSNQLLAALLAHLAEVEARGIHRARACASLYMYCVYELRLSEDAAFRRARAARLARRFPIILQQVADGELHLTAIVLLAPHLTEENHRDLLALAKHRTKREVLRLVRTLDPQPSVPDRVELLGVEPVGIPIPRPPTWRTLVESLAAGVRELPPGDRPKDWVDSASVASVASEVGEQQGRESGADHVSEPGVSAERYKVTFTASQEYVDLLEQAQDLLSHAVPERSLEAVHLRALRLLVERLEKGKYGAPRPKASAEPSTTPSTTPSTAPSSEPQSKKHAHTPRRRGPAAVLRKVRDRDGEQCTFVDESGQRCRETRFLEVHHVLARARGGGETARNLTIFCRAHNALAAEQDFGREFMRARVDNATSSGEQRSGSTCQPADAADQRSRGSPE